MIAATRGHCSLWGSGIAPRGRVSLWGRGPGRYFWFAEVSDGIQGCQQQHNQPLLFHTGNKPCFYDNSFYDTLTNTTI